MTKIEQTIEQMVEALDNYDGQTWEQTRETIQAGRALLEQLRSSEELNGQSAEHVEPVAHCEAGKDYCQQCRDEDVNTPLDAAVRYIQNNTPKLVSQEICEALNHIHDAEKMIDALQEIGDFAHDKSTGPAFPDALWEIRSMAYNALVEQRLSNVEAAQPKEQV